MNKIIIECKNISKIYNDGDLNVNVIKNINLRIYEKQSLGIVGNSGSGKSTLLHLLGGLDNLTSGKIFWKNQNINSLNETKLGILRNKYLGFIYQFHYLLNDFTALENVMVPLLISGINKKNAKIIALKIIKKVGLLKRIKHKPNELSGGERQRIAIARAIVNNPTCILADEPTGNLDKKNAKLVFQLLLDLKHEFNTSLVVVSHDNELIENFDKTLLMSDGKLIKYC